MEMEDKKKKWGESRKGIKMHYGWMDNVDDPLERWVIG